MDQCHDVLIIGPIQIGISTQIVRVAPQYRYLKYLRMHRQTDL